MQANKVLVVNESTLREKGSQSQKLNILAAKAVAQIIRSTLGPKAMLKMLLDPMGGIVMTNDGNAILREIDVGHPAAKSLIEIARMQDEEVGDGTTSVIVLAGEMLHSAEALLDMNIHPILIVRGYLNALQDMKADLETYCCHELGSTQAICEVIQSSIDTKFSARWGNLISELAVQAAMRVQEVLANGSKQIDIKRYAKVEKIAGGNLEDSKVLNGVMFNKDVTHGEMRRTIKHPKILLLDCPLEYKKGESQTNVEIMKEEDWEALLMQEENEVKAMCEHITRVQPDLVITEKGVSDLAQHFLMRAGISVIRRVRKTDNNRIARVTGASIVGRCEEIEDHHVGTQCNLFRVIKIGDEYYTFLLDCENPKACTILLRGGSKDVLNEMERNLQDGMQVARNVMLDPRVCYGGGATEMELSARLIDRAMSKQGTEQIVYRAIAKGLEVLPRTLIENSGLDVLKSLQEMRAHHVNKGTPWFGLSSDRAKVADVRADKILDTYTVKSQVLKSALENAAMVLRIDEVITGTRKQRTENAPPKIGSGN